MSGWRVRGTSTLSQVRTGRRRLTSSAHALLACFRCRLILTVYCVVRADSKEGADSDLDKYLPEADVVITTPFHPGYISAERVAKANKLKLALTAGIGSDHVDLNAAAEHGVTVAEITGAPVLPFLLHLPFLLGCFTNMRCSCVA